MFLITNDILLNRWC